MTTEEKALAAAQKAIQAAEAARRASDKIVSATGTSENLVVLTESGRLFLRRTDPNHFNDGRTLIKFMWLEIEGPLS